MTDKKDNEPLVGVDRAKYTKARAASGSSSLNNGDQVAKALEGLSLDEVQGVANKLIADNDFATRYKKLNPGMQRMNIGNRLRGFCRQDDKNSAAFDKAVKPFATAAATRAKAAAKAKADAAAARATAAKSKKAKPKAKAA